MANPMLQFKKGLRANLPAAINPGTIYVTTDERAMYVDIDTDKRIRLGDFIEYATMTEFQSAGHYSTTALYYIAEGHKLLKYSKTEEDGSISFVHLNSVQGVSEEITSIQTELSGLSTTVATIEQDYVSKAALATTKSELEGYADNAAGAVASDLTAEIGRAEAAEEALGERINGVALEITDIKTSIEGIQTDYATKADVEKSVEDLENAIALKADASALTAETERAEAAEKALGERIDGVDEDIDGINTSIETINKDFATKVNVEEAVDTLEKAIALKADASALTAEVSRAEAAETALGGRIDGLTNTVNDQATSLNTQAQTLVEHTGKLAELEEADANLKTYIDNQFKAADSMRFMGGTPSLDALLEGTSLVVDPAQAGDTYVLTSTDTTSVPNTTYAIGDLFIAKVDGDNTQWTHIASGYNQAHESSLAGESNKITLSSYVGANLGEISVVAAENSAIVTTVRDNTLTIGMQWGSFE